MNHALHKSRQHFFLSYRSIIFFQFATRLAAEPKYKYFPKFPFNSMFIKYVKKFTKVHLIITPCPNEPRVVRPRLTSGVFLPDIVYFLYLLFLFFFLKVHLKIF